MALLNKSFSRVAMEKILDPGESMPAHHYGSTVGLFGGIEDFPDDIQLMDRVRKVRADLALRNAVILENSLCACDRG